MNETIVTIVGNLAGRDGLQGELVDGVAAALNMLTNAVGANDPEDWS